MLNRNIRLTFLFLFIISCNNSENKQPEGNLEKSTQQENTMAPAEKANSKTIELAYHPAIEQMQLGRGVNIEDKMEFKPSALRFSLLQRQRNDPHVNINTYLTRKIDEDEGDFTYDTKLDACIPVFGSGDFKTNTRIKTKNKIDNLKLVLVLTSVYDPEVPDANQPVSLTDEASNLLQKPNDFNTRFGDYYCSSISKGHRAKVEINISTNISNYVKNFFQEGNAEASFDILSVDAKTSILSEVKRSTKESQSNIRIDAYGGVEVRNYASMMRNLFSSDSTYEGILAFLSEFIGGFEYPNAKPVKCVLSDYSTWGIPGINMMREDKITAQKNLKILHRKISKQMADCRLLMSNSVFASNYSTAQIENTRISYNKLAALRDTIYQVHRKLNIGDFSLVPKEAEMNSDFEKIKAATPEAFDYLVSRAKGTNHKYAREPAPPGFGLELAKIGLRNTILYNTLNSLSPFNFIAKISFVNNYTRKTISSFNVTGINNNQLLDDGNVRMLPLPLLCDELQLTQIASALDNDIFFATNEFIRSQPSPTARLEYSYEMVIEDKSGRIYNYPFYDMLIAINNPLPGIRAYAEHSMPESCCSFLIDYTSPEYNFVVLGGGPYGLNTWYASLKNFDLEFSDSVIFELITDNTILNSRLAANGENITSYSKEELTDPDQSPVFPFFINQPNQNFNELTITFYSKNKNNQVDSEKYKIKVSNSRKICMPIIEIRKR